VLYSPTQASSSTCASSSEAKALASRNSRRRLWWKRSILPVVVAVPGRVDDVLQTKRLREDSPGFHDFTMDGRNKVPTQLSARARDRMGHARGSLT